MYMLHCLMLQKSKMGTKSKKKKANFSRKLWKKNAKKDHKTPKSKVKKEK